MSQAVSIITAEVRDRVRERGIDASIESELIASLVREAVRGYSERALGGSVPLLTDEASTTRQVIASLTGFGALQRFLDDESIEEIWINAPDRVYAGVMRLLREVPQPRGEIVIGVLIDEALSVMHSQRVESKCILRRAADLNCLEGAFTLDELECGSPVQGDVEQLSASN